MRKKKFPVYKGPLDVDAIIAFHQKTNEEIELRNAMTPLGSRERRKRRKLEEEMESYGYSFSGGLFK